MSESTLATLPDIPAISAIPRGGKTLAWVLLGAAVTIVAYWTIWYVIPGGRDLLAVLPKDTTYLTFEKAFPAADGWLAFTAALSGIQLLRGKPNALPWLFMAAGAGMYLGGMDVLYDFENGVYGLITQADKTGAVSGEMLINVATLGVSAFTMGWAMKHRKMMCAD